MVTQLEKITKLKYMKKVLPKEDVYIYYFKKGSKIIKFEQKKRQQKLKLKIFSHLIRRNEIQKDVLFYPIICSHMKRIARKNIDIKFMKRILLDYKKFNNVSN